MFIVIPITMAAAFSNSGTQAAPVPGSRALCSLKSTFFKFNLFFLLCKDFFFYVLLYPLFLNLIHQADISVQGETLESTQAYINICKQKRKRKKRR